MIAPSMTRNLVFQFELRQQLQRQQQQLPQLQNQHQKVAPFPQETTLIIIPAVCILKMLSPSPEEGLSLPSLPSTRRVVTTN